ncbi:hypothetical protein [Bacillus sp. K2I17]|nr:hypothetical protein [Bacillus sp. K2I17]
MNFNDQQLQDFFTGTPLGKRLLAEAKKKQAEIEVKRKYKIIAEIILT